MRFVAVPIAGAFVVESEPLDDDRGSFARSFCQREFKKNGLDAVVAQCNISFNRYRGTLRGLHFQIKPHEEAKLVRCTRGAVWDVIVDLREESVTKHRWFAIELTAENRRALYIPRGFAHGFQTLVDDTEIFYQMSEFYHPEFSRGLRWNDPGLGITWPDMSPILSPRDASYPLLEGPQR